MFRIKASNKAYHEYYSGENDFFHTLSLAKAVDIPISTFTTEAEAQFVLDGLDTDRDEFTFNIEEVPCTV